MRRESVGRKIPDRELGEPLSSSGREERKVLCERTCPWGWRVFIRVVSELRSCLYISGKGSREKEHSDTRQSGIGARLFLYFL